MNRYKFFLSLIPCENKIPVLTCSDLPFHNEIQILQHIISDGYPFISPEAIITIY